MVALQPDFVKVLELAVFRNITRREVAVVIENRLRLGEFPVRRWLVGLCSRNFSLMNFILPFAREYIPHVFDGKPVLAGLLY